MVGRKKKKATPTAAFWESWPNELMAKVAMPLDFDTKVRLSTACARWHQVLGRPQDPEIWATQERPMVLALRHMFKSAHGGGQARADCVAGFLRHRAAGIGAVELIHELERQTEYDDVDPELKRVTERVLLVMVALSDSRPARPPSMTLRFKPLPRLDYKSLEMAGSAVVRLPLWGAIGTDPVLLKMLTKLDLNVQGEDSGLSEEDWAPICGLSALRSLALSAEDVPEALGNLTALTELKLSGGQSTLPASFRNLQALQKLTIDHPEFDRLPAVVGTLKGLESLDLQGVLLTEEKRPELLPAGVLSKLTSLTGLRANWHGLNQVPPCLTKLKKLRYIDLAFNELAAEENSHLGAFAAMPALEIMDLSYNEFDNFSPSITLALLRLGGAFSAARRPGTAFPQLFCLMEDGFENYARGRAYGFSELVRGASSTSA